MLFFGTGIGIRLGLFSLSGDRLVRAIKGLGYIDGSGSMGYFIFGIIQDVKDVILSKGF